MTRKCRICKAVYIPTRPMQAVCGNIQCAIEQGNKLRLKKSAIAKSIESKRDAVRKEAIKTRSDWMKEAQQAFNAFIRERDKKSGVPCISSGLPLKWNSGNGHQVDAGHYRSVGSAPHMRFDERNCHAQSVQDNRYGSGCAVDYRIGLIKRIGLAEVEALEADQTPRKWTIEDLKQIKATYKAKLRELLKAGE